MSPDLPFSPNQVIIGGKGRRDDGTMSRAIVVACQLYAAEKWDGRGRIVIRNPRAVHRLLQFSKETEQFDREVCTRVRRGVYKLERGKSFEVRPLSRRMARALDIPEENVLENVSKTC